MKKVFLALACVGFLAAATSCKKDCTCTTSVPGGTSISQTYPDLSKSDCEDLDAVGGTYVTCKQ